tara:strand:- start:393 stop:749 length:357 start_codon:yes stop_codon:yes gene_type:complete
MNIQGEDKDLELYDKEGVKVYEYYTYLSGSWDECTFDEKGKILTYKNSKGYWNERTYNENGNELTYKDSKGYWYERTYDEKGNVLTFKDSDGINTGFDIPEYTMENLVEKLGNFKLIK